MIQINATRCNVSNCEILQNSNTIYGNLHRSTTTTTTWDTNDGYANKQQQRMKKKISRLSSGIKATIPTMLILLVLSFGQMVTGASRDHELLLREERAELAHQWAPFVWLHPNEHFYPSSVIHFLQHAKPSTPGRGNFLTINEGNSQIILPSLPRGRSSWDTYLLASYNTECHNCHLPKFLYGQKPGRKHLPPTYVVIHSCTFQDHMRRDSTNSQNNPQEFLNNDNNTGHPSSFNTKRAPVSLLDKNQSHNLENGTTEATTILASRMPTSTTTSHNIHKNHQWNPLIRLQHNKDHSNYSQEKEQVLNSNNMQINHSSTVNVSLRQNLTKRNKNTHKITSTVSEATLMTTLAPQLRQTVKNEANNTSQLMDNMIDNSEILHAVNIQNDQDIYMQQKATSNFSNENTYETYSKDKKRDVVYDSNQLFAVTYWMFYPYNYAKEMCTANLGFFGRILKPTIHGVCHGEKIAMGNHVGDWEHITIQFKGRTPTKLYISSHNFGAYYIYHPHHQVFYYASQDTRKGIPLSPNYPPFLELDGTHPILYSALGSHGLWPTPGIHQYNNFPALEDTTGQGTAWHTWQNLEIIDLKYQNIFTQLQRHWLFYEGRWGNPSSKCYTLMGGFCENNHGPTGIPRKRINFPCPR